jgi:Domain of unknown function (DUF6458)
MTTLGGSLFLVAVGAILAFAVSVEADGFDINMIGVILMIVGAIGLLASFVLEQPYGFRRRTTVIDRRDDIL